MVKAVFIASSHSSYQDRPGEVYHFPKIYLGRVAQTVGDWVIFFEGRRGGSRGYYAVQRVESVAPDPSDSTHHFAILDRASELSFEQNVPRLKSDSLPYETGLPLSRGSNTAAVRLISDADFSSIVLTGIHAETSPDAIPRVDETPGFSAPPVPFVMPDDLMLRANVLVSRKFREQSFARQVKRAYGARCAMSGLELRNGGGRPEVEAAHILPVEQNGPDTVRNGLALSGTIHWMFDRGLLSVDGDGTILQAAGSITNEIADRLLVPNRRLVIPEIEALRPHPEYLRWHRENLFKG